MALRNHAACVDGYCDAILSGEIIAGRYVELAVRRYLDDIEHAHERVLPASSVRATQLAATLLTRTSRGVRPIRCSMRCTKMQLRTLGQ